MLRLLVVLAVVDTLHLVSSLLTFSLPRLSLQFCRSSYLLTVPATLPLAQTSLVMSVYITISLTLERYMSVCQPLTTLRHRQDWLSTPALVIPAISLAILVTSPNYVLYSYHQPHDIQEELNDTLIDQSEDIDIDFLKEVGEQWRIPTLAKPSAPQSVTQSVTHKVAK